MNTTFLSELRRGQGIGVCALDTSADIGASSRSVVARMKTSFKSHVRVGPDGRRGATLDVSGLPGGDESASVSL